MRMAVPRVTAVALTLLFGLVFSRADAQDSSTAAPDASREWDQDPGWPRVVQEGDLTLSIYQPQIDKFQDDRLEARAAVTVETKGAGQGAKKQTTYGVIWIKAHTQIDKDAGLVYLDEIEVTEANFPGRPEKADEYLAIIRGRARREKTISLARVQANLAITQADRENAVVPLKNDPPRIFYSTTPALLVLVDGDPVLRPVEGQALRRVVNTRALIVNDGSRYYMPLMDRWLQANSLDGPWSFAGGPPSGAAAVVQSIAGDEDQAQVDLLDSPSDDVQALVRKGSLPKIYVSTVPAELVQTRGEPEMKPIAGTQLLYVSNSEEDILLEMASQTYYVPFSGRWYRSKSLEGPWEFVDGRQLPADFKKIPENEPKASVLAMVPDTPQAKEAVIANSIPQTAEVRRDEAKLETRYDGQPQFEPIEGTPLGYAANSPTPVIRVDASTYYAVQDGIWFTAGSPLGPWEVAISVPDVIYTIPSSCPIHYVTYVRIYRYTPSEVYVGYTPGYMGMCYSPWGTVVYGTGWYYPPWIGSVWLGYPWTWGFGIHVGWDYWFGVSIGWGWGGYSPWRPWWGPYGYGWGRPHPHVPYWAGPHRGRRMTINHINVYNRRPGVVQPIVRPGTRPGYVPGPGGREPVVPARPGGRPPVEPSRPGTRPATPPSGPSTRPAAPPSGQSGRPPVARPAPRPAPHAASRQDVYAGRDGNVYRPAPGGNWQQYTGKDWKPMPGSTAPSGPSREVRPAPQAPRQPRQMESPSSLSRERQARQMGSMRANPRPAPRSAPRPSSPPRPHR